MCSVCESLSAITACSDILKDIWPWLHDNVRYKKILDEKKTTLIEEMGKLTAREVDCKKEIEDKSKHGNGLHEKKPITREEVTNWLENVKVRRGEVEVKLEEANKRRYFRRSKFLRLVEEKIRDVQDLLRDGTFPEGLFIYVHQDREVEFGETTLVGQSTKKIMETILDRLKNGTTIGVCGMGGSGKTTIVSQVHNKLLEDRDTFGHVYWVTVTEDSDIQKLQDKIANVLNKPDLLNKLEDKQVRAAELSAELKKRKKFVLILDDMWEAFPPEEVGIPIVENAGKIILTSRSREVCNGMSCQQIIPVDPLVQEEAWDLFMEKFGRETLFAPGVEECAKSFVNECDGLPLAIIAVAGSMRGLTDIRRWRTALKEFKECSMGANDMKSRVIKRLKFSYDRLSDEKLQQCFLYCALFPEDYNIQRKYLIRRWIAEGLVDQMETRQDEFDKGHDLLGRLEDAYLLENTRDTDRGNCVKMHDLIRDMALEITTVDGQFMVKTGAQLTDFPNEEHWSENLERVSLMQSTITRQLSCISPQCPKLCTLILQSIRHITEIPNSLFLHLQNLRVLDMSYMIEVECLPDSISDLEKLRVLLLRGCKNLRYVPSLAKLTELSELDLRMTRIDKLPHGLEKLVNLKSLLLQFVISDEEQVKGISSLEQLEVLYVSFGNLCLFTSYVKTQPCRQRNLTHYLLGMGGMDGFYITDQIYCRHVHITDSNLTGGVEYPLVLPTNMQEFQIIKCHGLTSLSDIASSLKNAKELDRCCIERCSGIEQLWSLEEDCTNTDNSSLHSLRTLMLGGLDNLRVIFNFKGGRVGGCGTFSNLKLLNVSRCSKLKYVFTQGMVQYHLQNLEIIHVYNCKEMENIIVAEDEENQEEEIVVAKEEEVKCPKLKRLVLGYVPKLKSIWRGTMVCPSLQQIKVAKCGMLKRLPLSRHSQTLSALQLIEATQEWWDLLEWDHLDAKSICQTRFDPMTEQEEVRSIWLPHVEKKLWDDDSKLWDDDSRRYYEEYY